MEYHMPEDYATWRYFDRVDDALGRFGVPRRTRDLKSWFDMENLRWRRRLVGIRYGLEGCTDGR